MSCQTILDLKRPKKGYRLDREQDGASSDAQFETKVSCLREDEFRAKQLRAGRKKLRKSQRKRAKSLRRALLDVDVTPETLASRRYTRDVRWRLAGDLWRLVDAHSDLQPRLFTIIPKGWERALGELATFDPVKELHAFRNALVRKGARADSGFLFCMIDFSYDEATMTFRPHLHGIAAGEHLACIELLRTTAQFCIDQIAVPEVGVRSRIRVSRGAITTPERACTYAVKFLCNSRTTYLDEGGGLKTQRGRVRPPRQAHIEFLLWLDRQTLPRVTCTIGLRVRDGRFALNANFCAKSGKQTW